MIFLYKISSLADYLLCIYTKEVSDTIHRLSFNSVNTTDMFGFKYNTDYNSHIGILSKTKQTMHPRLFFDNVPVTTV